MRYKFIISLLLVGLLSSWMMGGTASAAKKAEAAENLTRGDAIMLLAASDYIKKKAGELVSWTVGYDVSKVRRVALTPVINSVQAVPKKIPPDGRTVLEISAAVDDPGGLKNISGVRADLSSIGRLSDTTLVDTGQFGDEQAGDGVYTVHTSVSPIVELGYKDVPVAASNKKGWMALAKTSLEVKRNPDIIETRVAPERVPADGSTLLTITVKIDNPGNLEDVQAVIANLYALGLSDRSNFRNDGQEGDAAELDAIWTLQFAMPGKAVQGIYSIPIEVTNLAGGVAVGTVSVTVYK